MNHVEIKKSHFVGISLGTILIRQLADMQPKRVEKMIMGGAILELNLRSRILMYFGNATKSILPYMWLYRFFAFIIMPNRNHKESRILFIREAKKLYQETVSLDPDCIIPSSFQVNLSTFGTYVTLTLDDIGSPLEINVGTWSWINAEQTQFIVDDEWVGNIDSLSETLWEFNSEDEGLSQSWSFSSIE